MEHEIKEKITNYNIADMLEFNDKEEANAIINYNQLIEAVKKSDLSVSKKETILSEIYEIIGDELNHQERLKMLYSAVTNIKENKD